MVLYVDGPVVVDADDLHALGQSTISVVDTDVGTAGAQTITAAQMIQGLFRHDPNAASVTDTLDTAANNVAALPDAIIGSSFILTVYNPDTISNNIVLALGIGGSFVDFDGSSPATITISAGFNVELMVRLTSVTPAESYVAFRMGSGTTSSFGMLSLAREACDYTLNLFDAADWVLLNGAALIGDWEPIIGLTAGPSNNVTMSTTSMTIVTPGTYSITLSIVGNVTGGGAINLMEAAVGVNGVPSETTASIRIISTTSWHTLAPGAEMLNGHFLETFVANDVLTLYFRWVAGAPSPREIRVSRVEFTIVLLK